MSSSLSRKIAALLVCTASFVASQLLLSQDFSKSPGSSAVDAQGVRHRWSEYGRRMAPWIHDAVYAPRPQYPYEARTRRIMGSALFRMTLDLRTGVVIKVTMIKSTGSPILDNACLSAFRQWRFNPGRWKEVDLPVIFVMASGPPRIPPPR
jgi:TonB family protein